MSESFICVCGRGLQVADALKGTRVRCPACRSIVRAPGIQEVVPRPGSLTRLAVTVQSILWLFGLALVGTALVGTPLFRGPLLGGIGSLFPATFFFLFVARAPRQVGAAVVFVLGLLYVVGVTAVLVWEFALMPWGAPS